MIEQITWRIWGALHTPPPQLTSQPSALDDAPLQPSRLIRVKRYQILAIVLWVVLAVIILGIIASVDWLTIIVSSVLVLVLSSAVILVVLSGTINGARWAYQVAQVIYRDLHEDGRYELMSLSPLGTLGAIWLITHQQTKTNRIIEFFQTIGLALFLALILVGLIFIYTLLQGPPTLFLSQPILGSVLTIGLVIVVFYVDYVQAVVVGHLCGIVFATMTTRDGYAEVSAMTVLIAIQIFTYLIAGLVAILSAIFSTYLFRETTDASLLLIGLAFAGMAYGFREVVIRVLWRTILTRFTVTDIELAEFG